MSTPQLACLYAGLILSESGKIDGASIEAVTKAAGLKVSPGLCSAYADALKNIDIHSTLSNLSFGAGGAPAGSAAAASPAAGSAAAPAAAAKKEETESDEDDDIGFGLFD